MKLPKPRISKGSKKKKKKKNTENHYHPFALHRNTKIKISLGSEELDQYKLLKTD